MSSCRAQQWFTCAQAGLQPLGHSYTLGTEETVKWGNSFEQTAAGPLLSVLLVIQQRIKALLPVSHPGHATLRATWGSDFGSHEQNQCIGTFCCDRAAVPAVSEGLALPVPAQISLHGTDTAPWDRWLLHKPRPKKHQAVAYPLKNRGQLKQLSSS